MIGYQSRDYLENLFVNDISQYKFYQGYIREKGTKNAIDRLLKAKYEEQDLSLDLYPEWMIKTGQLGNVDSRESIQFVLNQNEIKGKPQSIELFDTTNTDKDYIRSLGISKQNLYSEPVEYKASETFARYDYSKQGLSRDSIQTFKTAGYPQVKQVQLTAFDIDDLLDIDVSTIKPNSLVWVANKSNKDWDVFKVNSETNTILSVSTDNLTDQLKLIFANHQIFQVDPYEI